MVGEMDGQREVSTRVPLRVRECILLTDDRQFLI